MSVALPRCTEPPTAVGATLLTARLTRKLRGELVSDLTTLAGLLSRTAAL